VSFVVDRKTGFPLCPDHNILMTRLQVEGAPLHGQSWWLCEVMYTISLAQRPRCGNTTALVR
jgi:hypothetical protein